MAEDKKKKGKGGAAAAGVAVVLLAGAYFLSGNQFGLGPGFGFGTGNGQEQAQSQGTESADGAQAPENQTAENQTPANTAPGSISITVREGALSYNGQDLSQEELQEALLRDYAQGVSHVEVYDDHAVKADYDAVVSLLESMEIPYEAKN